jgi:adenylate cyclase class 2
MKYEVEQKHRVEDAAALRDRLAARGAILGQPIVQSDEYFAHPARDFAATDEALRIRTVGDASVVTYKGPKLDATTKTRRELELPLAVSHAEFAELLTVLGFRPVLTVRKTRRPFELAHRGQSVHGTWDEIEGVGTFVELELTADDNPDDVRLEDVRLEASARLAAAKQCIASLAIELELGPSERRSYLELLLERGT